MDSSYVGKDHVSKGHVSQGHADNGQMTDKAMGGRAVSRGPLDDRSPIHQGGMRLTCEPHQAMVSLQGCRLAEIVQELGLSLGTTQAWLVTGPGRGIWVSDDPMIVLPEALAREAVMWTDVSHAWCRMRLTGTKARTLLQGGVSADLSSQVWNKGSSAPMAYRDLSVLLHEREAEVFDIYVFRSLAHTLWDWLEDATAGFQEEQ